MNHDCTTSPPLANGNATMPSPPAASKTRVDSHGASSATGFDGPTAAATPALRRQKSMPMPRRRGSMMSDFSQSMQDSTESLLLPRASANARGRRDESTHWHSIPLAFAILPAVGGLLFENGSAFITDVFLLGLSGLFLNWFVRSPWEWYYSAQEVAATKTDSNVPDTIVEEREEGDAVIVSRSSSGDTLKEKSPERKSKSPYRDLAKRDAAAAELRMHENVALLACFLGPLLGAYLLHRIRTQLTRPSEGLVSNFNLTIFVLAAELRPCSHLITLIQSRTLHLQRIVRDNSSDIDRQQDEKIFDLQKRLEDTEARIAEAVSTTEAHAEKNGPAAEVQMVRQSLQPQLDALNRAVRRYEKRYTTQTIQTEARLQDLEARLRDALSLAAVAAHRSQRPGVVYATLAWTGSLFALPMQALWSLFTWPLDVAASVVSLGKKWLPGAGFRAKPKNKKIREKEGVSGRPSSQKPASKSRRS